MIRNNIQKPFLSYIIIKCIIFAKDELLSIFNWYIQNDGLLCGDLCLVTMRQNEYILEKNGYREPEFIMKQDIKYKKTHTTAYRFHAFVKINIIYIKDNIAVIDASNLRSSLSSITIPQIKDFIQRFFSENKEKDHHIVLQNMDSFFYFNDIRRKIIEERIQNYAR